MHISPNVAQGEVMWVRPLVKTNLSVEVITASYLFANQETPCYRQSMGEVVNAVGQ